MATLVRILLQMLVGGVFGWLGWLFMDIGHWAAWVAVGALLVPLSTHASAHGSSGSGWYFFGGGDGGDWGSGDGGGDGGG